MAWGLYRWQQGQATTVLASQVRVAHFAVPLCTVQLVTLDTARGLLRVVVVRDGRCVCMGQRSVRAAWPWGTAKRDVTLQGVV